MGWYEQLVREQMARLTDEELWEKHFRLRFSDDRGNRAYLANVYAEMRRRGDKECPPEVYARMKNEGLI